MGGCNARVEGKFFDPDPDGEFYIVQGVWRDIPSLDNPLSEDELILFDLIAWHPKEPRQWYFLRGEAGRTLGERAMSDALLIDRPLQLHRTPFAWLQSGCTYMEISDKLCIEQDTIKKHMQNIFRKLKASNGPHAAVIAILNGLIVP